MTNRPSYENSHNMCNAMHVLRGHTTGHRTACSWRPPPRHTQCVQGSQWVRQWCRAGPRRGQKGGFGQLLCFSSTAPVVHHAVVAAASVSAPSISAPSLFSLLLIWYLAAFLIFIGAKSGHYHHPIPSDQDDVRKTMSAVEQLQGECQFSFRETSRRQRVQ